MSGQGNSATPTVVITGVEQSAADTTAMSLLFDLPKPVVVTHSFGADGTRLVRTVSDVTGLLDCTTIDLEHACVPCAIREDVLPTIAGLASSGHWSSIIARLRSELRRRSCAESPPMSRTRSAGHGSQPS